MPTFCFKSIIFLIIFFSHLFVHGNVSFAAQISVCELEDNNALSSATPLPLDKPVSGTINPLKDLDYYKISLTGAGLLSLSLTNVSNQIEPFISLLKSDGSRLETKTADAAGLSINLERMLSEGDYYICVGDTPAKHISLVPYLLKASFSLAKSINCGEVIQGSIGVVGAKEIYNFTASANDTITIRCNSNSGNLYAYLELYAPDGTNLAKARGQIDKKLASTGTYTIIVRDEYNLYTGGYALTWMRLNNPCNSTPLAFGQTVSGTTDSFAKMNAYSFSVNANDKVNITFAKLTTTSGYFEPSLELYDSTGARIAYASSGYPQYGVLFVSVPTAGNLCLIVTDQGLDGAGTYELTLQRTNNPANVTPIAFGQTVSGTIGTITDVDFYKFTVAANDTVSIRFSNTSTTSGYFEPRIAICGPDGTPLVAALSTYPDYGKLERQLTVAGTYYILVRDNGLDGAGTYSLSLQRL